MLSVDRSLDSSSVDGEKEEVKIKFLAKAKEEAKFLAEAEKEAKILAEAAKVRLSEESE